VVLRTGNIRVLSPSCDEITPREQRVNLGHPSLIGIFWDNGLAVWQATQTLARAAS